MSDTFRILYSPGMAIYRAALSAGGQSLVMAIQNIATNTDRLPHTSLYIHLSVFCFPTIELGTNALKPSLPSCHHHEQKDNKDKKTEHTPSKHYTPVFYFHCRELLMQAILSSAPTGQT